MPTTVTQYSNKEKADISLNNYNICRARRIVRENKGLSAAILPFDQTEQYWYDQYLMHLSLIICDRVREVMYRHPATGVDGEDVYYTLDGVLDRLASGIEGDAIIDALDQRFSDLGVAEAIAA